MDVIWPGLQAEVDRRREVLVRSARPRRPPRREPRAFRHRVGWAVIRLGLAVTGPAAEGSPAHLP